MAASLARSLWFIPTIASLFSYYPNENSKSNAPPKEAELLRDMYDYVIVGGGTAGSIVANRLSEDPSVSVLVLEAGGQESYEAQIPAVAPYLQLTEFDWQYKSVPSSTSCLAMNENRCNLPRGKVLGGSSSINLMLYVRGNKNDFDSWENLGNPEWGYDKILPYFKKSEDNKDSKYAENTAYHGVGGYQKIKEPFWKTPLADAFLEGGKELGYNTTDVNAENQTGFMFPQGFYDKGARFSCSRAFLQPIRERQNLNIKLHSLVTKIRFDKNGRANIVEYERGNQNLTVLAKREIILCGGAFSTPHLLMLSGIGPALHLKSIGITPFLDLPVGRNLQDHIAGQLPFVIDRPMTIKRDRMESFASIYQYTVYGSGPLSTLAGVEGIGFVHTKYSNKSLNWPDIEFQFVSGSYASDNGRYIRHTINLNDEHWDTYLRPLSDLDVFTILVKLLRPRSRGYIELESSDPKQMPKIVTNYLTEPVDTFTLIDGLKIAKALSETKAFKSLGTKLYNKPLNGCELFDINSDQYWECFLRHLTLTIYHYSGTAKMGPYWDAEAVVDPELRVYGTSGLRVIDASIFPAIPSGNTNAAVMMVAEKGSDMIKSFWRDVLYESSVEEFYGLTTSVTSYSENPTEKYTFEETKSLEEIPTVEENPSKLNNFLNKHFMSKRDLRAQEIKLKSTQPPQKRSYFPFKQLNEINEFSQIKTETESESKKEKVTPKIQTEKVMNESLINLFNKSVNIKYIPSPSPIRIFSNKTNASIHLNKFNIDYISLPLVSLTRNISNEINISPLLVSPARNISNTTNISVHAAPNISNEINIAVHANKLFVNTSLFRLFDNTSKLVNFSHNKSGKVNLTETYFPQLDNNMTVNETIYGKYEDNTTQNSNVTFSNSNEEYSEQWDRDHIDL